MMPGTYVGGAPQTTAELRSPARTSRWSDRYTLVMFAAVSLALVAIGVTLLIGLRVRPEHYGNAPMAEYYLAMACRCPWPQTGVPWSIHGVTAPYRYRVLVPWIAGLLPFETATSLSLVTYASLGMYYFLILLTFRRLGIGAGASMFALVLPYVFEAHFVNYYHPFLVEGFGLMMMALMLYALTIDSFWLFAIAGLVGVFAREVVWFVLPVWCARDLKRGIALTVVAAVALLVERAWLWGAPIPYTIHPVTIALWHLHGLSNYVRDVRATWGWVFPVTALGLALLPPTAFRTMGPMALGLFVAALCSTFMATDTPRLFGVMMPAVAIATAQLITLFVERRQRLMLACLFGLVVLQFLITPQNGVTSNPHAISAIARPIKLGTLWALVAAFLLRRELADGFRDKVRAALR